jgi:hypothetical protein
VWEMMNSRLTGRAGMCRVDPAIHDELVEKIGCRTMIMKDREYKGYVYIMEESVKTKKDLEYWLSLALSFNLKAKASKKK